MESKRVTCPACNKEFGIYGGLNAEEAKKGVPSLDGDGQLKPHDFTVCTGCYQPLEYQPDKTWKEVTPEAWVELSVDDRTMLQHTQDILKNRNEKNPDKKYSGAIVGMGERTPEAVDAALRQVGLTIVDGLLKEAVKNDEDFEAAAHHAIVELGKVAMIGLDEFGDRVRVLVSSTMALLIVESQGSVEKARAAVKKALGAAEKEAKEKGVSVVNMSDKIPS